MKEEEIKERIVTLIRLESLGKDVSKERMKLQAELIEKVERKAQRSYESHMNAIIGSWWNERMGSEFWSMSIRNVPWEDLWSKPKKFIRGIYYSLSDE